MADKKQIYTVSQLTRRIKLLLEQSFAEVWVEGEISNFTHYPSGHMYFSLKDDNSVLSTVLFKNVNQGLKFELKNGMQVICFGKVSLYEKRGQYQLTVIKIEPKGVGALQLAFEQLKARLAKEGLFDSGQKKPLPFLPKSVGVVTSPKGAAIRDILKILKRRFANLQVIINPVRVQGQGAAEEIASAIDEFNRFGKVDVLIVGRGGGSLEDLWAFNEEVVARAIYRSRIPVISAVGHEIDYTISDFVADLRCATPSEAAEKVVTHKQELLQRINNLYSRIKLALDNRIELWRHKLENIKKRYAFRQPADLIQQYQQTIDGLRATLDLQLRHLAERYQERCKGLAGRLRSLSPLNILSRGYSISLRLPEREIVKNARALKPGVKVETKVAHGAFVSKVEGVVKNGRDEI